MKNRNPVFSTALHIMKEYKLLSAGLLLVILGTIITGILPPFVLERMVNRLAENEKIAVSLVIIYFLTLLAAGIFDAAKEGLIAVFGQKVTHGLRSAMCDKLLRLPASYFTRQEPGVITSRFVGDVDTVETLFTSGIIGMAVDACKVISVVAIIFLMSSGLGVLMLIATPLLFFMTRVFQKKMFTAQLQNRAAVAKANNHVPETIKNIRMIHVFQKEHYMEERYDTYIGESYHSMEKSNFYDAVYSPMIITISAVIVAVMMVLSAKGGMWQNFFGMSVGTAVAVIAYVGKVFEPLESIGMEIQNIQSAVAGVCRINEFLKEEERKMPQKMVVCNKNTAAVQLSEVEFGYQAEEKVLQKQSFTVQQGEKVTLSGRTGVGKSTIFKLILGMYQPWSGTVKVFGENAAAISDEQKRQLFGYVEQTFRFVPGNVMEQITLKDASVSKMQVEKAMCMVGLEKTILELPQGYETPCTKDLFSQGQIQLLSIARAIVADPKILLLDEITANLDVATEESVLKALKVASQNRTVISISHRLYRQSGGREISL